MKKFCRLAIIFLLFFYSFSFARGIVNDKKNLPDVVSRLLSSVVNISTTQYNNKSDVNRGYNDTFDEIFKYFDFKPKPDKKTKSLGSGFFISQDGLIVTNEHVIRNADKITIITYDNKKLSAKLVGKDSKTDIALLKVDYKDPLPYVTFGDSSKMRIADSVIAIGNPFGFGNTVTTGIISSITKRDKLNFADLIIDDFIQTDAAINSGNSGGPMFNLNGEVIGINFALFSPYYGGNIGIGFAIPSIYAKAIVDELIKTGDIKRGELGIMVQDLDKDLIENIEGVSKIKGGALVAEVIPSSSADLAGVRVGDVIISFNDKNIKTVKDLTVSVFNTKINTFVNVVIIRNGVQKKILIKMLEGKKQTYQDGFSLNQNGVVFSNINDEVRNLFSLKDKNGIVVKKIFKTSSWRSVLQKNDIIFHIINFGDVKNISDWKNLYEECKKRQKKYALLQIKRFSVEERKFYTKLVQISIT